MEIKLDVVEIVLLILAILVLTELIQFVIQLVVMVSEWELNDVIMEIKLDVE